MALYAFDGTWNSATLHDDVQQDDETNVARFSEAYQEETWYVSGPGTRYGNVGRVIGGLSGAGGFDRVDAAYKQLCANFATGDSTIDIIGFSRGAALVLDFANRIARDGIRKPNTKEVIVDAPAIRFIGLWDVVGSFGIPIGQIFQKVNLGHKLYLPGNVTYCFHAMAMDERRQTFRIIRLLNSHEVWFRGVHSDIGGGNGNVGLSAIALRWMLSKAIGAGLPLDTTQIDAVASKMDPAAKICPPTDLIPNEYRGFLKDDRFHYTVEFRDGHNNASEDSPRESESDESFAIPLSELPPRQLVGVVAEIAVTDPTLYTSLGD
jgi:uncharacterized protein (DUF2235 family)